MPMLDALDLLEMRGLRRDILLLSTIEALEHFDQAKSESLHDMDAAGVIDASRPKPASRRHACSWNCERSKLQWNPFSSLDTLRVWAIAISTMGSLRTITQGTQLPAAEQPVILKVPRLSLLDLDEMRGLPRRISLLSTIEADSQTTDNAEQINIKSSEDRVKAHEGASSRRHARTWNGSGCKPRCHVLRTCTSHRPSRSCSSKLLSNVPVAHHATPICNVCIPLQRQSCVAKSCSAQALKLHSRSWSGVATKLYRQSVSLCTMRDLSSGARHIQSF